MATWWGSDEQTGPVLSSSWRWPQPPPKPLPNQIPIDGEPLTSPRGFLLRRLSDAGPRHGCTVQRTGRHPKPFTKAAIREVANLEARTDSKRLTGEPTQSCRGTRLIVLALGEPFGDHRLRD